MHYRWKKFLSTILALSMLLMMGGCTGGQDHSGGIVPTDSNDEPDAQISEGHGDPIDEGHGDPIDEDELAAILDAQEELLEKLTGKYFTYDTMTPERQAYRLSCIQNGINLSTNGGGSSFAQKYKDALRNVYNINGQNVVISGTVAYVDRQGYYTTLLIQIPLQNIIVLASTDADIPVIKNDEITVFGWCNGPATYTKTNEYGVATDYSTFGISIRDYYIGGSNPINDYNLKHPFEAFPIEHFGIDKLVNGAPTLTDEEAAYWYGTYESGITLSESIISIRIPTYPYSAGSYAYAIYPYTAYSYSYDDTTGAYVIRFRYTEIKDLYPENEYSFLCLSYNSFSITTKESVERYLYDALWNAGLSDSYYRFDVSPSDNYVGNIQH